MSCQAVRQEKLAKRYLIECGEKDATHETKEDDSEAIFWNNVFLHFLPGCSWLSAGWRILRHRSGRRHGGSREWGEEPETEVDGMRRGTSWSARGAVFPVVCYF